MLIYSRVITVTIVAICDSDNLCLFFVKLTLRCCLAAIMDSQMFYMYIYIYNAPSPRHRCLLQIVWLYLVFVNKIFINLYCIL